MYQSTGKVTVIKTPMKFILACTFGGPNWDVLMAVSTKVDLDVRNGEIVNLSPPNGGLNGRILIIKGVNEIGCYTYKPECCCSEE